MFRISSRDNSEANSNENIRKSTINFSLFSSQFFNSTRTVKNGVEQRSERRSTDNKFLLSMWSDKYVKCYQKISKIAKIIWLWQEEGEMKNCFYKTHFIISSLSSLRAQTCWNKFKVILKFLMQLKAKNPSSREKSPAKWIKNTF